MGLDDTWCICICERCKGGGAHHVEHCEGDHSPVPYWVVDQPKRERDALAATVDRVRALCDAVEKRGGRAPDWSVSTARVRAALEGEEADRD